MHSEEPESCGKAYLIDAKHQRISTIDIDVNSRKDITDAIGGGCRLMELAATSDNGDCLMVDEEGWRHQDYLFAWKGKVEAGNGVLIGPADDDGYSKSVQTSELDCAMEVEWPVPAGFKVTPELRDDILSEIMVVEFISANKPSKSKGDSNE